ncbi:unnamed protein product [Phytophthora fragariaefolia]|uniref:Unnamed protein product n=1 Tax=Phytophthora fragariaefolia TaxID=1490495 RepID=A0A9W6WVC8_9STRA|nr:unnamed protein product [Phytophthora fragariaefolia]
MFSSYQATEYLESGTEIILTRRRPPLIHDFGHWISLFEGRYGRCRPRMVYAQLFQSENRAAANVLSFHTSPSRPQTPQHNVDIDVAVRGLQESCDEEALAFPGFDCGSNFCWRTARTQRSAVDLLPYIHEVRSIKI